MKTMDARLANESWESLFRAHTVMMRRFEAENMWQPISMREYDVLYTLSKAGCSLRATDLNEDVLMSQPALSRLVDRLITRGYVTREPDAVDGRAIRVSLTDAGREIQREIGRRHARSVTRRMAAALSDDEMATLTELTRKITEANSND